MSFYTQKKQKILTLSISYVGHRTDITSPYYRAEMYAGRVACFPKWVTVGQMDGRQTATLRFPLLTRPALQNTNYSC